MRKSRVTAQGRLTAKTAPVHPILYPSPLQCTVNSHTYFKRWSLASYSLNLDWFGGAFGQKDALEVSMCESGARVTKGLAQSFLLLRSLSLP